jgi:hypothetical protein
MSVKPTQYSVFIKHRRSNTLYDKSTYKNIRTPMVMLCLKHLHTYKQVPFDHNKGCNGCKFCQVEFVHSNKLKTHKQFVYEAHQIHGNKYKYPDKYKGTTIKLKIICHVHGEFHQVPAKHINNKQGCPKCAGKYSTLQDFIDASNIKHDNKYCYDSTVMGTNKKCKVLIKCHDHGLFSQTPKDHLSGRGCPKCRTSKGELEISKILTEHSIKFTHQFKFLDCKHINDLYFDFKIDNLPICIEYDGRQHFEVVNSFGGIKEFELIKRRDSIKNKYCLKNGIKLFRISYKDNLLKVLSKIINYILK